MILNLNFKLELFNEIRAKNEEDLLEADEQGLTLIPRQQALDLISDSAKVTDSTWDQIILDLALTREREREWQQVRRSLKIKCTPKNSIFKRKRWRIYCFVVQ